jgi:predicted nucleotidyltransferase
MPQTSTYPDTLDPEAINLARQYHARREARRTLARERVRQERYQRTRAAVQRLAPTFPNLRAVYLFGSVLQYGRHGPASDIDVAVESDDPETESRFWQALEAELGANVDLRPLYGAVARAVSAYGERIYEREVPAAGTQHQA